MVFKNVMVGEGVFNTVGIHMGTNCAPLLAMESYKGKIQNISLGVKFRAHPALIVNI
jgi:hypothetical protein